jgi:hypothetical protein
MTKATTTDKATNITEDSAPTTVAEAQVRVAALARDEVERYRRLFPKKDELFAAQQAQDFRKAAELREEVEYLEDDDTGRQKRRSAILHLHSLQADELEAKAAALDIEIAERQKQSKLLFGKLEDLEGSVELRQRYLGDRTKTRELEVTSGDMKQQARRLRYELNNNSVADHGRAHGVTADELVEAIMQMPENLGPTIASVHEWVLKRRGTGGLGQRMSMKWYGSRITELEWDGIIFPEPVRKPGDPGTVQDIKRRIAAKVAARS